MLEYGRINKTNGSCECTIYHSSHFFGINFRFQPKLCDGCYDLMEKAMSFNDIAIFSVKGYDYRIRFWYMRKDEVINVLRNVDLTEKKMEHYKTKKLIIT